MHVTVMNYAYNWNVTHVTGMYQACNYDRYMHKTILPHACNMHATLEHATIQYRNIHVYV